MRVIHLKEHLEGRELLERMNVQKDLRLFRYWQILYCIHSNAGKRAEEYANLLGVDVSKIYRVVQLYNKYGAGFCDRLVWGGRRDARSLLSLDEERLLMDRLKQKASKGQILTMNDIRLAVEKQTRRPVSDDYLWDLFKRHGWKKKAPRPSHPKKDAAEQETFKKNSLTYWSPA